MRFGTATAGRGWPGRFPFARREDKRSPPEDKWKRPGQDPRPGTDRLLAPAVLLAVVVCAHAALAQKPVASHGIAAAPTAACARGRARQRRADHERPPRRGAAAPHSVRVVPPQRQRRHGGAASRTGPRRPGRRGVAVPGRHTARAEAVRRRGGRGLQRGHRPLRQPRGVRAGPARVGRVNRGSAPRDPARARRPEGVRPCGDSRCQASADEAARYYADNRARFVVPEQLHVYAITFGVDPGAPPRHGPTRRRRPSRYSARSAAAHRSRRWPAGTPPTKRVRAAATWGSSIAAASPTSSSWRCAG